jgi:hypothetical protein
VINHRQEAVKLDHNFGRLSAYGRYTHEANPSEQPLGLFGPNCLMPNACSNHVEAPGWTFAGHFTFTKSATTLIDGGYNFSYGAILADVTGTLDSDKSPNVKPTLPYANTQHVIPALSFTNSMSGIAIEPRYRDYNRNHQIYANLTKVVGRHTWKFGGTYYHYQKTENAAGNNHGTFNFNGVNVAGGPNPNCNSSSQTNGISNSVYCTEQGWANFLLGRVNTFTQASIDITPDIQDNQFEFFAQDEWRIKSNLTISYGLRYSLFRQPTDANGLLTTFDPKYYDPAKAFQINPTTGDRVPGTGDPLNGIIPTASALKKCPTLGNATSVPCWGSGVKAPYGNKVGNEDMKDFAPRVGVAWDPFGSGKTSLRSGFGYFYDTSLFGIIEQNIFSNPPFSNSIVISNTNFENPGSVLPSVSAAPVVGQARAGAPWKTPRTYHYNLDLQQQFVHGILFTAGYFGNVGRNLIGIFDLNQPQVGAYVGTAADASVGATTNPCGTGHCVTSGTTPRLNALRPYKGYFGISTIRPIFNSNYNSLQSTMTKRFRGNSSVGIAYTWSHALTDNQSDRSNAPQNTYNIHGDYGPTLQDRRHIFTANWVYELPWLKDQKGFLGHVAGGWELTGILTAQTGLPNTVTGETLDRAGQGCLSGSTVCGLRPDQIGDPNIGAPHQWNGPGLGSTGGPQWITGAAFIQTPGDQIRPGTERRGPVYGPGFWRTDLSAVKNFKVTERVAMQFRADAFNVLNHTNPNGFASLAITSAIFGQISTATSGVRDPRQIALGLKVNF